MWAQRTLINQVGTEDQDVEMAEEVPSSFRFLQSEYTPDEITLMRKICETAYGFPAQLQSLLTWRTKTTGRDHLMCETARLSKAHCTNEALRKIQNTIQAQVEGDLILKLQADFPVYADFQTRARLVGMSTMGLQHGRHDKDKVTGLLKDAKQVYYDRNLHAVYIIFWTRISSEVEQRTPLTTFPEQDIHASQIGADGQKNEGQLERYHIRLLNVSRSTDEAAIDAYISKHFEDVYTQRGKSLKYLQTDTSNLPSFPSKSSIHKLSGTKILVHHVSVKAMPPCFQCSATKHNRSRCHNADDR
ncbi:hypothetical protein GQ600_5081 [Phytophthora cactorum]|nr:hypothetical protein GQ600_5081 [Phytophthora cactorum]